MNPIPRNVTVNTGDQPTLTDTIDDFFLETKEFAEKKYNLIAADFLVRSGEIRYRTDVESSDRVTYLMYHDRILAGVFETRTEWNYVRYTFFRNLIGFDARNDSY
jgi:hypothetical protein